MKRRALFLDRDGVINVDHGYVARAQDFEPVEGVFDALRAAAAKGYLLVVVTNQSGIGRGYFSQEDYDRLEGHMRQLFASEGIDLAGIYHCPHDPAAACQCRKPEPGMLLRAAREHEIDLAQSVMVGDKLTDVAAGQAAGVGRAELVGPQRTLTDLVTTLG